MGNQTLDHWIGWPVILTITFHKLFVSFSFWLFIKKNFKVIFWGKKPQLELYIKKNLMKQKSTPDMGNPLPLKM